MATPPFGSQRGIGGDVVSMLGQMLELMREQNKILARQGENQEEQSKVLKEQNKTLKDHGTMLEILKNDVLSGMGFSLRVTQASDQAGEGKSLVDRMTWKVLGQEAVTKTKEKVDQWKDLMDVSLIFIAIFLTVVTAFITPVIQAFTAAPPDSNASTTSSKPPLPPLSIQLVAFFYYLALIVSRRKALAEGKLIPLMGVLFWSLLLSIALFIIGLLIQLWALAFSCEKPAFVLIVGGALGTGLSVLIFSIILATTYHAAIHEHSPFESPLSVALQPVLEWWNARKAKQDPLPEKPHDEVPHDAVDLPVVSNKGNLSIEELMDNSDDDSETVRSLKIYARLVFNTNDPDVLERVAPSFEFCEWYQVRDRMWPVFEAVWDRFMGTDASTRAKETVRKQLVIFRDWDGWKDNNWSWRLGLHPDTMTDWCKVQCGYLISLRPERHRTFFPPLVFFTSLEERNADLRDSWDGTYEGCVRRVLSSYHQKRQIGDRYEIFSKALWECRSLILSGKSEELEKIVGVGRISFMQSIIRNPDVAWFECREIIEFLTKEQEVAILDGMTPFLSKLSTRVVSGGIQLLFDFLASLVARLPPDFALPPSLDLPALISVFLAQRGPLHTGAQQAACEAILYLLHHGGFWNVSKLDVVYQFFIFCTDEYYLNTGCVGQASSVRAALYLGLYRAHFVALPGPSQEDCSASTEALKHTTAQPGIVVSQEFTDAVKECNSIASEGRFNDVKAILSQVDTCSLLKASFLSPDIRGNDIAKLIPLITNSREQQLLHDLGPAMTEMSSFVQRDDSLPSAIEFFAQVIPSLLPDYVGPQRLDLSSAFDLFSANYAWSEEANQSGQTRRYLTVIIYYLDHGGLGQLSDADCVKRCCENVVSMAGVNFDLWEEEEQQWNALVERARHYLKEISNQDEVRYLEPSATADRRLGERHDVQRDASGGWEFSGLRWIRSRFRRPWRSGFGSSEKEEKASHAEDVFSFCASLVATFTVRDGGTRLSLEHNLFQDFYVSIGDAFVTKKKKYAKRGQQLSDQF
ncbi:hypothetical protein SISNIDRAFT_467260 [Sistotremastrum niveocremeum HHB9708]|uniref:DUF6535 domain-containing protein n=1 Tax=Sistotremastrum niveocremeum HHB9708 TaxID=1314777 RepID=A0A164T2K0_9AGAM|nr:hypothetical protein SISNIDRAFT_467260 [Sistotremastrum niveocremeum HHB9708]